MRKAILSIRLVSLFTVLVLVANITSSGAAADPPAKFEAPKGVTIQGDAISLSQALAKLMEQTTIKVEDRRREPSDGKFKLNVKNASFWQALDEIAKQADVRIYPYREQISIVDGNYHEFPTSYNGIFRIAIKRLAAYRDLESDDRYCVATLEIAWDPRYRPFLIDTHVKNLTIKDDKDRPLAAKDEGGTKVPVESPNAMTIDVRLPAPQRSSNSLNVLKGELSAVLPSKMLEFTFDSLETLEKDAKAREQTKERVTVRIGKPALVKGRCALDVTLEYPPDGPEFESFQSWLLNNVIYLQNKNDKKLEHAGYATDALTKNQARLTYNFRGNREVPLEKLADWKMVYRTPGLIVEVPLVFEFKDVPLP